MRYLRSSTLYFGFVAGLAETAYLELNLPLWCDGRPDRFSGIEVVGEALDQEAIVEGLNACECSYPSVLAEQRGNPAHEWTNQVIHPEVREYLAQLPLSLRDDNLCFVHGSPHNQHEYLLPEVDAFVAMERVLATGADILFCGHTHVPYVRSHRATLPGIPDELSETLGYYNEP